MSAGLHTVHVRVNDAATGQPTPCRVRFTGPDGSYYAPFGRQTEFARGWNEDLGGNLYLERWARGPGDKREVDARKYAFIEGTCEIRLPPGKINVEVWKGPEYTPIDQEVHQPLGKMALRLTLERWADLRADVWYSGDARCHLITPHAALLEAAAEDVAVVNLLAKEYNLDALVEVTAGGRERSKPLPAVPNLLAFSGQRPALEMPGHMVVVNTQNHHGQEGNPLVPGALGQLSLLNCHRVVYPLRFGSFFRKVRSSYRREGWDDWTLADWCDQCHRKGGLVVWSDNGGWRSDDPQTKCGEALADLILGKVDAYEIESYSSSSSFDNWYHLLNCGFQVPLVGASGKDWNNHPLGFVRTYAKLSEGQSLSYGNWIEAVRGGRTFVTIGPLVTLTADGQVPGSVLQLPRAGTVHVRAEARSLEPFESLDLVMSGKTIGSVKPAGWPAAAAIERDVRVSKNGWLAAYCRYDAWCERAFIMANLFHAAHTSPVYLRLAGQPLRADPKSAALLDSFLADMLDWVRDEARCETDKQREDLAGVFRDARQALRERRKG